MLEVNFTNLIILLIVQHVALGILKQLFPEIFRLIAVTKNSHRRCSMKKAVKNFTIFTGKHLCSSLFLIKLFSFEYHEVFQNTYFENICEWLFSCNSPALSTVIFQIYTELLLHIQLSLLRAYFA